MSNSAIAVREAGHLDAPQAHAPVLDFSDAPLRDKWQMAEMLAQSQLVPKDFQGKPGDILIVADLGASLGMSVAQSLQSIACIKGRPAIWGDGLKGVVVRNPLCEWVLEVEIGACASCKTAITNVVDTEAFVTEWRHDATGKAVCASGNTVAAPAEDDKYGYRCSAKRRGEPNVVTNSFTLGDAKRAKLLDKEGPWTTYGPRRMCRMRARAWTLRDAFPDVLKGLAMREEIVDVPDAVRAAVVNAPTRTAALAAALDANAALAGATRVDEPTAPALTGEVPPDAPPGKTLEQLLDEAAQADPPFGKFTGAQLKAYVHEQGERLGLKPWQVTDIAKSTAAGRLVRANIAEVLRLMRRRAIESGDGLPAAASAEAVAVDEVPADTEAVDFAAMTTEQLLEYVKDHAAAVSVSNAAVTIILRAHAEQGLTADNIGLVLCEIDKRGAKA